MKTIPLRCTLFLIPLLTLPAGCAGPTDREVDPPAVEAVTGDPAAGLLERLDSFEEPPELERLETLVGDWTVRLELLDGSGETSQLLAEGSARIATDLGGRYLEWRTGLRLGDRVVHAHGMLGFDVELGIYQFLWASELASGMRIASGRGDPELGGIDLEVAERDPRSGEIRRSRSLLTVHDRDRFTLEQRALDPSSGEWVPLQRTSYVRSRELPSASPEGTPGER